MEPTTPSLPDDDVAAIDRLGAIYKELSAELSKIIIGQQRVVELLSIALFSRGHALLMVLWQAVTIRLCSAKEVSAHTKPLQETLLIFRLSRLSKSFPTFLLLLIRAMRRVSHGLLNRLQWQQLPQVQTVLS